MLFVGIMITIIIAMNVLVSEAFLSPPSFNKHSSTSYSSAFCHSSVLLTEGKGLQIFFTLELRCLRHVPEQSGIIPFSRNTTCMLKFLFSSLISDLLHSPNVRYFRRDIAIYNTLLLTLSIFLKLFEKLKYFRSYKKIRQEIQQVSETVRRLSF